MDSFEKVIPVRNCEHEINNELVTVLYRKKKLTFIEKIFFKKWSTKPYKIDLDKIGSYIWNLCDGKRNVSEITEISREQFSEKIEPANERVELFIKQMNKNKLISLFEKKEK
jgi:hypothetical protein